MLGAQICAPFLLYQKSENYRFTISITNHYLLLFAVFPNPFVDIFLEAKIIVKINKIHKKAEF
ncbi:MAG TPA: hypothetical protein DHM37_05170 [Candidatus Cloacimonas sp.]|jgi:hypothetical protein|nr:hypothetical protein [Candidatus Cloacimonas sp.]